MTKMLALSIIIKYQTINTDNFSIFTLNSIPFILPAMYFILEYRETGRKHKSFYFNFSNSTPPN